MPVAFAAALSEHPLATHAVGEVVGEVLDQLGEEPDLAVLFVTGAFAGATDDVAHAVRALLRPRVLVGATVSSVLADDQEVEERPAVVLFAATWADASAPVPAEPWACTSTRGVRARAGGSPAPTTRPSTAPPWCCSADPFSFPVDGFVDELARRAPGLTVIGGLALAAVAPAGTASWLTSS